MHQTTVRFSHDLWDSIERECGRLGVSVAQYLREAAIARIAYASGRRHEPIYAAALEGALRSHAGFARETAEESVQTTDAVFAQSRLARERAHEMRLKAEATRARHKAAAAAARKIRTAVDD